MIPRLLTEQLRTALADTPVVLVQGARQTGKSTLVRDAIGAVEGAEYRTLDDALTLSTAVSDPGGFLASAKGLFAIDEVQKAPALLPAIKQEVDQRRTPGRFVLTGSAQVLTLPRVSESLAGRMEILTLWPLSQSEIERTSLLLPDLLLSGNADALQQTPAASVPEVVARIVTGGYPEVCTSRFGERRSAWFRSYLSTLLQRDVRDLAHIEGLTEMPRLLSILAARAGGLLNYAGLSRDVAIPQTTLKRYLTLLQQVFLIRLLPPWFANVGQRVLKSPKVYLTDSGLLCELVGRDEAWLSGNPDALRPVLENFVVMELVKHASWSRQTLDLFHYRAARGHEVDVVIEGRGGRIAGLEIKASSTLRAHDFTGLKSLAAATGERFAGGAVLYLGREMVPFARDLWAIPVTALWHA